jgi:hypothetical protein
MRGFRKILGGPVGQFLFLVVGAYFASISLLPTPIVISLLDAATVGVGLVFCAVVAREVWNTLNDARPERAALWATGAAAALGSTVVIRFMRIGWGVFDLPWLSVHWTFGLVTATQWAGFVLCLAALVAPDNGTIFDGTRRPMVCAAIWAALAAVFILAFR